MERLIIASIVGVLVSYIGISIRRIFTRRVKYLIDYNAFLDGLVTELSYYRQPLIDYIDRVSDSFGKDFRHTLIQYKECIKKGDDIVLEHRLLTRSDGIIIQNCFNSIGMSNVDTELASIKNSKHMAESMLEKARKDAKIRGELWSKLAILLGIALLILLV